ncbi:hypothetical protein DYB32_004609 [Aphanomyces invadans]|uniref:FYVE-type domain-containing protein n=1 Tax=Aphanomyces invadans TaxID=157072 RepID=A0A3R7D110_9STRA|nr:hypothetical protein DYB32_004609 [Aphanomyces invadans]
MQRSGLVFVESDLPGFLNVTQMAVVDLKGTLPRVLSRLATKKYLTEVLRLNRFLHEKRLSLEHILPAHNLVPKRDRTSCHVCVKKFRVFSRHKVRCRKCGEVVCMQCQGVWAIDMSTAASSHNRRASTSSIPSSGVKKVHVRVCINCSQDTRERSMHHKPSILNTQILHTNPASEDEMFALDTMALIPTSHALPDQVLDEDDDISPMDVLQSARSRALHEYVRRTSTASLTSSFLPNHQNPSTAVDSTQSCQARAPQVDSDDDEIEDHVVFRQTKSVPDDTMSYAESSPTSSKDEPQFGPRGLSHSFVSEASSFRPSFTIFKKSTLTTSSQQPVLPSSMLLTSPSYRAMNKDTSPTTFEEESSQHRQLRKPRHHSVHVSTAPTSESTATSTTSSATTSRRGSLPLFSNLAAQVDAALHYGHHTAHVPPPSSHSSTMALLSATSPSLSSSRSSWRHRSSNSLFQSPANRHSHQRRPYTPRKSSQTFQFQDSKLVGMRTSTGTYTSEDLKSIERSLLADAKKYSVAVDTPDSSALSSSARGSSMVLSARGKDSSWTNVRSSTRVGRENNSSFLSSCNHTPATTTSSSLSFSDDDTTLQLEGLREKVQLTLNATSSSTLSSASEPEPDVVALYKQMKALRVAM